MGHNHDKIQSQGDLHEDQFLRSANGKWFAVMQEDGNFVIYSNKKGKPKPKFKSKNATWSSNTHGKGKRHYKLRVQNDGNVVVYDGDEKPIWASDTWNKGKGPYVLVLQDDGNLVLYDSTSTSTWASGKSAPQYSSGKPISNNVHFESANLSNHLPNNAVLHQDQSIKAPNFEFYARVQSDGNFVLYNNKNFTPSDAIWASNTHGKGNGPYHLKMQDDGNLVLYDSKNAPIWASDTWHKGKAPYHLTLQDDGNLVLYDAEDKPTWASNTHGQKAAASKVAARPDKLKVREVLHQDEYIKAPGFEFYARLQSDGNFVLYNSKTFKPSDAIWASNTHGKGKGPYKLKMQEDGNLVIYDAANTPTWATDTWNKGTGPHHLVVQDDGNLVLYDSKRVPTWASNTHGKVAAASPPVHRDTLNQAPQDFLNGNTFLQANHNEYYARVQTDGNFVIYKHSDFQSSHAIWSSNTYGKGQAPYQLRLQDDGNLVLYDKTNAPLWASDTWKQGQAPYRLIMQDDGNLVLYDHHDTPTWASNTYGK